MVDIPIYLFTSLMKAKPKLRQYQDKNESPSQKKDQSF